MRVLKRLPSLEELAALEAELQNAVPPVGKSTLLKLKLAGKASNVVGVLAGGFFAYMGIMLAGLLLAEGGAVGAAVVVGTLLGSAAYLATAGSMRLVYRRMLVYELDGPRRALSGSVGSSASSVAVAASGDQPGGELGETATRN